MNLLKKTIAIKTKIAVLWLLLPGFFYQAAYAQLAANPDSFLARKPADTTKPKVILTQTATKDIRPKFVYDSTFSPKKATIRSALIPGWGQLYNHQIWKLPLVYGAIGTTVGIFIYNITNYNDLRKSYILITDSFPANDVLIPDRFKILSANSIKFYRDQFRRNVDYSVLAFLIAWGLNVADATVTAHLRQFDVSDDLSLKIKPTLSPTGIVGIGLVMNFKNKASGNRYGW